ncbi:methionyl-tRNA formyltransferase [Pseudogracilibacillus auburnensis]|uniref:Methionyl-tRNA formyltransferase n=1 Tax=Pseudogracilibacillus auburnensis TaxID=1494959 RepID=A0A2V3W2N1_9BACI|nr:methionyl-tRNA formyltransferase [Pseudogracilibacillus auburnensis]PXW88557.1 methionyl-tRNA formyltransferase [Pseudogracilibacillus auburnensis]
MKKIIFMGTPDFAVPILQALIQSTYEIVLVVTQPDRPKGRKRVLSAPPVKEEALKHQIPVFQPEKLRTAYEEIFSYEADLIVTAAYGQLLPKELLDYPTFGSINVHASLLPKLRGGAPIHYALLQGKKETGITIMYMVEKLDAGDIITQEKIPILQTDHVGTLHDTLSIVGAKTLLRTLPDIFARTNDRIKQKDEEATFAANITREQEKIDWHKSNKEVYNQIRGLHPWPVAYTYYDGERMKIWWGELTDEHYADKKPGEIVQVKEHESFTVVCGNNKGIHITEVQPAGRKRMTVTELFRGNPNFLQVGQMLE